MSPAVIAGLTEAMKDSDPDVRKQAMQALTRLGAPLAYETLVQALKDEDAEVREQAAFSLGQMGDSRAIDPLTAALKDVEPDVRRAGGVRAVAAEGGPGRARAAGSAQGHRRRRP